MTFDAGQITYILSCYFIAAFIKGITGLGFSTICLPLMILLINIKLAIPLVLLPSLSSNVAVMINAGHFKASTQRFWPLYLATIPGLLIGLWILHGIDADLARSALGIILAIYAIWALWQIGFTLASRLQTLLAIPTGFITGLINGVTGSQLMPLLPYLLSLNLNKNQLVQASNISFTLSSLIMLIGLNKLGYLTLSGLVLGAIGIIPVIIGVYSGGLIRNRIPDQRFKQLILLLLLVLGLILLFRAF